MNKLILAGDIGGTNLRLALFTPEQGLLEPIQERRYATAQYDTLETILSEFLGDSSGSIGAACFGVAGPVCEGAVELTNIPHWETIREITLRAHLRTPRVELINDMTAMAYGVLALREFAPDRFFTLNAGAPAAKGNVAIIAAGTGLGEGYMFWDGKRHHPCASEGGHTDFAPSNDLQDEMLQFLRGQFGHVSYERILSGPGIFNIYQFLRHKYKVREPQEILDRFEQEDPTAVVSELGLAGKSAIAEQTLDLFMSIYGAEAGNMALKMLTTGGVYVGGGIAPKLMAKLRGPAFMEAFLDKGRSNFRELLQAMPVKVITEPNAPMFGAAYRASQLLGE